MGTGRSASLNIPLAGVGLKIAQLESNLNIHASQPVMRFPDPLLLDSGVRARMLDSYSSCFAGIPIGLIPIGLVVV